jgi:hypothetical protein
MAQMMAIDALFRAILACFPGGFGTWAQIQLESVINTFVWQKHLTSSVIG